MTILRDDRPNKRFSSRLTSWVDRLLQFQFEVAHAPDRTVGMADYLSRHLSESTSNESIFKAAELWHNWFTVNEITRNESLIKNDFVWANHRKQSTSGKPIKSNCQNQASWLLRASNANVKMTQMGKLCAKQIQRQLASIFKSQPSSKSEQEAGNNNAMCEEIIEATI